MRSKLIYFLLILSISAYSQELRTDTNYYKGYDFGKFQNTSIESIESYNNTGEKDGLYLKYYRNGNLYIKGYFKSGKKDGLWQIFDKESKIIIEELNYVDGKLHGDLFRYYIDEGKPRTKEEGTYKNGLKSGKWSYYQNYYGESRLESFGYYKKGLKSGVWKYFIDGELNETIEYVDGNKTGDWQGYFYIDEDTLLSRGHYKNGKKAGDWFVFENSLVLQEGNYINGKKTGVWKSYTKYDGKYNNLLDSGKYINGKKEGTWIEKKEYGDRCIGKYINNQKEGVWYITNISDTLAYGKFINNRKEGVWNYRHINHEKLLEEVTGNYWHNFVIGEWKNIIDGKLVKTVSINYDHNRNDNIAEAELDEYFPNGQTKEKIYGQIVLINNGSTKHPDVDENRFSYFLEDHPNSYFVKNAFNNRGEKLYQVTIKLLENFDDGRYFPYGYSLDTVFFPIQKMDLSAIHDEEKLSMAFKNKLNSKNNGKIKVLYPNGNQCFYGNINNNKAIGIWTFFNTNGKVINELNFDIENINSFYSKEYYSNGIIMQEGLLIDTTVIIENDYGDIDSNKGNFKNGFWTYYSNKGVVEKIVEYGFPDLFISFYNGIYDQENISNYMFNNSDLVGYPLCEWQPAKKPNEFISVSEDGKITSKGMFINNKMIGYWEFFYYATDVLLAKGNFDKTGVKIGKWLYYGNDGQLELEENFNSKGEKHGIIKRINYFGDTIISQYKKGKEQFKDGEYHFENGELEISGSFKKNKRVGKWTTNRFQEEEYIAYYNKKGKIDSSFSFQIDMDSDTNRPLNSNYYNYSKLINSSISFKANGDTLEQSIYKIDKNGYFNYDNDIISKITYSSDSNYIYKVYNKTTDRVYVNQYYNNGQLHIATQYNFSHEIIGEKEYYENGHIKRIRIAEPQNKTNSDFEYYYNETGEIYKIRGYFYGTEYVYEKQDNGFVAYFANVYDNKKVDNNNEEQYDEYGELIVNEALTEHDVVGFGKIDSLKVGSWVFFQLNEYSSDTIIFSKGEFENGMMQGYWQLPYETGVEYGKFENNLRIGKWVSIDMYQNDTIRETYYQNGEIEKGTWFLNNFSDDTYGISCRYKTKIDFASKNNSKEYFTPISTVYNGQIIGIENDTNIVLKGSYENNKPDGIWQRYYSSGALKIQEEYSKGIKTGSYIEYDERNIIKIKGEFVDGFKEGNWMNREYYYNPDDEYNMDYTDREQFTISKFAYLKGKKNGLYTKNLNDSILLESGQFQNDHKVGDWKIFNDNGSLIETSQYKNGLKEGKFVNYSEGKANGVGYFLKGKKDAQWVDYYENTNDKKNIRTYAMDSLDGIYQEYYKNGQIKVNGKYNNGQKSEIWQYFDVYGQFYKVINYSDIIQKKNYSPLNLIITKPFHKVSGYLITSENGQFAMTEEDGKYNLWDLSKRKILIPNLDISYIKNIDKGSFSISGEYYNSFAKESKLSKTARFIYNSKGCYNIKNTKKINYTGAIKDFNNNDSLFITVEQTDPYTFENEDDEKDTKFRSLTLRVYNTFTEKLLVKKKIKNEYQLDFQISPNSKMLYELTNDEIIIRNIENLKVIGSINLVKPIYTINNGAHVNEFVDFNSNIGNFEMNIDIPPLYFYSDGNYYFMYFENKSEFEYKIIEIIKYDIEDSSQKKYKINSDTYLANIYGFHKLSDKGISFFANKITDETYSYFTFDFSNSKLLETKTVIKSPMGFYAPQPFEALYNVKNREHIILDRHQYLFADSLTNSKNGLFWYDAPKDSIIYSEFSAGCFTFNANDLPKVSNDTLTFGAFEGDKRIRFSMDLKSGYTLIPDLNSTRINKDSKIDSIFYKSLSPLDFEEINSNYYIHYAQNNKVIVSSSSNSLRFWNRKGETLIDRTVDFVISKSLSYIFYSPDRYYFGSKGINEIVYFEKDLKIYPFEQFDLKYNRPDIILDRLGYADSSLIAAYHQAYLKRLKKMNFTEDMLKDDFHLPEIKIENFEQMPTITDSSSVGINLQINDSKYKLDRINIWVNDVAIYGSNGISLREKNIQNYSTRLSVDLAKGKNKVQVSVHNQAGAESYKETFEIECKIGKEKPDLYLITIGESKFKDANYNLTYAAKDAHDVASQFSKSGIYEKVIIKTLTNEQVTKENIQALKTFLAQAGINDEVMIFIAGHGVLDEKLDYFFASYDMDFNNPSQRGIAYEDLEGLLDGIKPLKKVLLIDACHSGEIDKEEVELLAVNDVQEGEVQFRAVGNTIKPKLGMQNTSELTKALFTDLRKGTGATVISSAGGGEYAMESGQWKNGLFTYCLLKGIETKAADLNNDGEIWLKELQEYVQTQVTELSGGKQQPTSRIENSVLDYRIW